MLVVAWPSVHHEALGSWICVHILVPGPVRPAGSSNKHSADSGRFCDQDGGVSVPAKGVFAPGTVLVQIDIAWLPSPLARYLLLHLLLFFDFFSLLFQL
jgi:hypothetical protein